VTIGRTTIGPVGRMGVAPVAFDNGTMTGTRFVTASFRPIDFEPDTNTSYTQTDRHWVVDGAVITGAVKGSDGSGTEWLYIGSPYSGYPGNRPVIDDITVKNCRVTSSAPTSPHNAMHVDVRDYRASRITLTGNTSTNTWGLVLTATNVDTLVVTNNDMNFSFAGVQTSGCTNVTNSGNT
jgi:hypothetical protein